MKALIWRVSLDNAQSDRTGLIFFDDIVHAFAFSPCGKLLAVEGQDKALKIFLVQDFQTLRRWAALVAELSLSCFWEAKTCRSPSGMGQLRKQSSNC